MDCLVDTSVLARLANNTDAAYAMATAAVLAMRHRGVRLRIAPQNLVEFRNVATRPTAVNGLGLSVSETEAISATFEATFPVVPETPEIHPSWKALVHAHQVLGKQVHDARLVAICHVQGIEQILTFNSGHFARFVGHGPGIVIVDPRAA